MPAYTWMAEDDMDFSLMEKKINAMRTMGVPYEEGFEKLATANAEAQALLIATDIVDQMDKDVLEGNGGREKVLSELKNKEIIALIAYLQRLGTDIEKAENAAAELIESEEAETMDEVTPTEGEESDTLNNQNQ